MGMQISTLTVGNSALTTAAQEPARGKRAPVPMGQNVESDRGETALLGSRRSDSMDLRRTASDLEQIGRAFDRRLQFVLDQESREITVKVIDTETDKVIRVLPPEELQRVHGRIRETMGFLFDRTV